MNNSMQRSDLDKATARREGVKRKGAGRHFLRCPPELRKSNTADFRFVLQNRLTHNVSEIVFEQLIAISGIVVARTSEGRRGTQSTSVRHATHSRVSAVWSSSHWGCRHGI
ncbi:MAG: hypothetical protein OXI16_03110 [Chloroflexota bacterium]|nr:hypothetical protein [Chloroflexota bacterium]